MALASCLTPEALEMSRTGAPGAAGCCVVRAPTAAEAALCCTGLPWLPEIHSASQALSKCCLLMTHHCICERAARVQELCERRSHPEHQHK